MLHAQDRWDTGKQVLWRLWSGRWEANKTIENTIRKIRENQADKEKTRKLREEMEAQKQKLFAEEEEEKRLKQKIEKIKKRENTTIVTLSTTQLAYGPDTKAL